MKPKILIVEDEEIIRFTFQTFLSDAGYEVITADDYSTSIVAFDLHLFDLIFVDIILGRETGMDVLKVAKERGLTCPVIVITGSPDLKTASEAVRLGAFDYLSKPVTQSTLLRLADRGIKHKRLVDEKEKYRAGLQAIFSSVQDAIIAVDQDLTVTALNEANKRFCGCTDDLVGKQLADGFLRCQGRCLAAVQVVMSERRSVEFRRIECVRNDQQLRIITLTASPLQSESGAFLGAVMVKRDETRLVSLEQSLKERTVRHRIIGESKEIQKVLDLVESLAHVETTALIVGESGTGKELIAEALHTAGPRKNKLLVKVNCAALPDEILASELFGHVKGAFTGASTDRVGRFQQAHGGIIFLDEIGDISPKMQLSLLRVLQEKEFERLGDSIPVKVDVRIIAATNRDLRQKVKRGEFREDLYYRLNVVEIRLPPLRERKEDIPVLVQTFIQEFKTKFKKDLVGISDDATQVIMEYTWPGNVRELRHALEHAFILAKGTVITIQDLPSDVRSFTSCEHQLKQTPILKNVDPDSIRGALELGGWNKTKAARIAGVSRRTIYRKIKEYGITDPEE